MSVYFRHAPEVWTAYPELVPAVLHASGITRDVDVAPRLAALHAVAEARLARGPESELPEIQAWRRAFTRMGLKPTQYRCASEALLRRFRKECTLPQIHPLIDLCNAASLAKDLAAMPTLRPVRARIFDMFPQTTHFEVMVLLERVPRTAVE